MQAKYDARNMPALKRLVANGTQLRAYSHEILEACWKAANEVFAETSAKNANFKKIYDAWVPFRDELDTWFSVAEGTIDRFMLEKVAQRNRAARKK